MDAARKGQFKSISEYISLFPEGVRAILEELRGVIAEAAPEAEEAISYQMPTFKLNGNLVHFAAFKHHIGFYPGASGVAAFEQELSPYGHSKGSIQFPLDEPIPLDLVRKIVVFRVEENSSKSMRKSSIKRSS
jgi:uncharacterized protein YdhG (YjbR/CyaY superfamily)